ncbi:MAG: Rrf2 family transcriptional regulator [Candidatus Hydrogenedentes bacterium]|nr:Rrf2 family transcriptional regulator [Candidatus Hydrogenedentota bacterium]
MKISTKVRYGVRLIFELAMHYGRGQLRLHEIATRQEVSEKYLEHLAAALKAGGLIRGVRGRHGGYVLARAPSEIRLSEIHVALDGSLALVECVDDPEVCRLEKLCVSRDVWMDVSNAMRNVLESTTLQDLVERQHEKLNAEGQIMYYI